MRNYLLVVSAILMSLLQAGIALAQNPFARPGAGIPPRSPAVSPYLNLFRAGNSPAFNYFTLVKPELEFRQNFQQVQQQFGTAQQNIQTLSQQQQQLASPMPPTGHPVGFMTHSRYFMNLQGSGTSPGVGGGIRAPAAPPAAPPPPAAPRR